jgi:hypothetical protein
LERDGVPVIPCLQAMLDDERSHEILKPHLREALMLLRIWEPSVVASAAAVVLIGLVLLLILAVGVGVYVWLFVK